MRTDYAPPPLIEVFFEGELGQLFGSIHRVRGHSTHELVQGICANKPELRYYLLNSGSNYEVYSGETLVSDPALLTYPISGDHLIIRSHPAGSGGVGRLVGGLALLGVGLFTGGTSIALLGLSLAVNGASQLLSPQPKSPKSGERDSSFLFDSLSGASQDGDPVPLPYGDGPVAGIPLAQSISTSDISG